MSRDITFQRTGTVRDSEPVPGSAPLRVIDGKSTETTEVAAHNATRGEGSGRQRLQGGVARERPAAAPAFEQVFIELAPYVLRVLPRLGVTAADLEDVCQDVFVAVHRKLPGFERRSSVRTWVYGICIRTASNYRQRAHMRYEKVTARPPERSQPARQLERLKREENLALLDRVLNQLGDREREVVVLYEIEQLGMSEVADVMGCSKSTAYARLYAARRQMKKVVRRFKATGRMS